MSMIVQAVCFTGHRDLIATPDLSKNLTDTLKTLIDAGATDFYAGGAIGWDTFAAKKVIELRESCGAVMLHLLLPCPPEEQTAKWPLSEKAVYNQILSAADSVEICSEHYNPGCMRVRNERLIAEADCCVCYYDESRYAGGTAQTVRMARNKGILVKNLYQF